METVTKPHPSCDQITRKLEFPDPCSAIWLHGNIDESSVGVRWIKQRRMQSRIFGHARLELAERGCEGIQLRSIAQNCDISVQTIYNLIGDRFEVIMRSAEEWVTALGRAALDRASSGDISVVLSILGTFWCAPLRSRGFVSNATECAMMRDSALNSVFREHAVRLVTDSLRELRNANDLRANVHIPSLARQLVATVQMGIYDWTLSSGDDPSAYWSEFEHGPALMLRASACGAETTRIESTLQLVRESRDDGTTHH